METGSSQILPLFLLDRQQFYTCLGSLTPSPLATVCRGGMFRMFLRATHNSDFNYALYTLGLMFLFDFVRILLHCTVSRYLGYGVCQLSGFRSLRRLCGGMLFQMFRSITFDLMFIHIGDTTAIGSLPSVQTKYTTDGIGYHVVHLLMTCRIIR